MCVEDRRRRSDDGAHALAPDANSNGADIDARCSTKWQLQKPAATVDTRH
jgi:hypothetical protein